MQTATGTKTGQAPLIFQGGNCLIGDDFWLLGKDYFADTVRLVSEPRGPVQMPEGTTPDEFVARLFTDFVDADRRLIVVGTNKPIPLRSFYGTRVASTYFLDIASDGAGTFQPIFHIDMLITLIGKNAGKFDVFVGSPAMADALLGRSSPFGLNDVYDTIAQQLTTEGFNVRRNPLVHQPTEGSRFSLSELRELAQRPGNEELGPAVDEFAAAGATVTTQVTARSWHHITWNNCLVENSTTDGQARLHADLRLRTPRRSESHRRGDEAPVDGPGIYRPCSRRLQRVRRTSRGRALHQEIPAARGMTRTLHLMPWA